MRHGGKPNEGSKRAGMSATLNDVPLTRIDGEPTSLGAFAGNVILVVNVASKCGQTPQYESLERLYAAERERGLVVLGFPSNQFRAQEPGTNEEIAAFCSATYGVTFPMFEKIDVNGPNRHPLYSELVEAAPEAKERDDAFRLRLESFGTKRERPNDVLWNFEKFLIARDGRVVARFAPDVAVDEPFVREAIERELARV